MQKEKKQFENIESIQAQDIRRMHVGFGSTQSRRHVACCQHFEVEAKEQKEQVIHRLYPLFLTAHIQPSRQSFGEAQQMNFPQKKRLRVIKSTCATEKT